MCLDTACFVMSNSAASSLTVAGPRDERATMARRTGSASAMKARSSHGIFIFNSSPIVNLAFDQSID